MRVLSVDLAAKFSAYCVMNGDHEILAQGDSWQITEDAFISRIYQTWWDHAPLRIVIEDLPHGLKYSTLIKSVCRLQGRIIQYFSATCDCDQPGCGDNARSDMVFVAPATWRYHYPGLKRGTGPTAVVPVSAEFNYKPPDLALRSMKEKGGKAAARKVQTDYCSAYLIARWAIDTLKEKDSLDVVGTSRWNTPVVRKKDLE